MINRHDCVMTGGLSARKNEKEAGVGLCFWKGPEGEAGAISVQVEGRAIAEVQRQEDARPSPNSWSWKMAAPWGSMSGVDSSSGWPGALSEQFWPKEPRDTAGNGRSYGPQGSWRTYSSGRDLSLRPIPSTPVFPSPARTRSSSVVWRKRLENKGKTRKSLQFLLETQILITELSQTHPRSSSDIRTGRACPWTWPGSDGHAVGARRLPQAPWQSPKPQRGLFSGSKLLKQSSFLNHTSHITVE